MKLFTSLAILAFPLASTMGEPQMQITVAPTNRELAEDDHAEDKPLTQDEIEALFLQDMEAGVGITMGELEEDSVGNLRGRQLQSSTLTLLCKHSDCTGGHVWVSPGRYASMPWQIGNDELSRVYIPAGHTFTYYQHTNFQGWQATFGEPSTRINLWMGGHNDSVSSFVVRRF